MSGLTKRFGGVVANRAISFAVRPGELVGVIGPNGAGKSTLFDLITGFTRADAGTVHIDGRDVTRLRPIRSAGSVSAAPSRSPALPRMSVLENVMIGAFRGTADVEAARQGGASALERVGLGDRAAAHARGLSTGQRKRLELARALATPACSCSTRSPEASTRRIPLVALVRDLRGLALVVIEHNMRVIMEIAQRCWPSNSARSSPTARPPTSCATSG